jgi:hypothetical protein
MNGDLDIYIRAPNGVSDSSKYLPNGVAYGNCPFSSPWMDVAQYNIWNPKTRSLLQNYMLSIASYADGIRSDMSHLLFTEEFHNMWGTELDAWGWKKPSDEFWLVALKNLKSK